ncbi:hypothetical protein N7491_003530 [Penicillium cf. griseofulvum]|uniref:Uncharacterized protein n=1 Tax=Penicillium cf. griseofulvum TaxID=2972120 RepID=A0A9W9MQV2_9EURO|nr:hypothetical protein N7472_002294 [Penicillium cf. griseofulvum]KAJ5441124.1 hypothetical protein N7491_003530 [Penicillium cf. griseofulvum]KAJ5449171.1 hypothetical protein N7445_003992 [Penicillium cf. griseofulvum]
MSHNQVQETSRHIKQRRSLVDLEAAIEALDVHKLDTTRLKKFNVTLCEMTLGQNSKLKPHFFAARPNLPQPSDDILDEACSSMHSFTDLFSLEHATYIYWESYAFHDIDFLDSASWRLYQYDAPAFGAFTTTDIAGSKFPHFKATIYNDLEADDETCFRGELLVILRLMLGQLRKMRLVCHHKAPVLLISLAGNRARLLESYFDDESASLIVRSSGLYELSDRISTSKVFKTLAEYYLGNPAGNTA